MEGEVESVALKSEACPFRQSLTVDVHHPLLVLCHSLLPSLLSLRTGPTWCTGMSGERATETQPLRCIRQHAEGVSPQDVSSCCPEHQAVIDVMG